MAGMMKKKQMISWLVVIATVFVVLFSFFYVSEHATHHCNDRECPICEVMEQCSENLKTVAMAILMVFALFAVSVVLKENLYSFLPINSCNSLIFQKVRLND